MLIPFQVFPNADGLASVNDIAKRFTVSSTYLIFEGLPPAEGRLLHKNEIANCDFDATISKCVIESGVISWTRGGHTVDSGPCVHHWVNTQ